MSIKMAYKEGFAEYIAEAGIAPSDIDAQIIKRAGILGDGGKMLDSVTNAIGKLGKNVLLPAGLLGLVGLPTAVGWSMGQSKRTSPADLTALTDTALIKDYQEANKRLKEKEDSETKRNMADTIKASSLRGIMDECFNAFQKESVGQQAVGAIDQNIANAEAAVDGAAATVGETAAKPTETSAVGVPGKSEPNGAPSTPAVSPSAGQANTKPSTTISKA